MERDKFKRLNKATVATILAASGVAVVVPQPTHGATFKDLNSKADYYKPVLELAGRGVVGGYSDGTFRPNNDVTRGQAAKMLALALKLDVKNVKNPKFKDIPTNHQFYPYIAALAKEGIINGYADQTFRPNEPITRGQIAKILTLGYQFGVASKLKNPFNDVSTQNSNAHYIQTLVDLEITKGTSPITFSPSQAVTRGQLATFIIRAENAGGSYTPVNIVGKVDGNQIYINSIPYTIDSSLTSILNERNEAVLQGAFIEGEFNGKTIKSIKKLTLNASGSENRFLELDGNNSVYSGQLMINGSHIKLKNWSLTGSVILSEPPRKSLSRVKPLENLRIASLSATGFIDWSKPTDQDEGEFLNPDGSDQLNEKPTNNKDKEAPHMMGIEKYVDFSNCTIERLTIEQNRTYISSDKKIASVTVQKNVEHFDFNADAGTLYLEGDQPVIMYGASDFDTVFKNSYYSVYFNANTYIDLLAIDNSFGWIDLGEEAHVGKAVLPVGKSVNDIFDDFGKDNGNIGKIEDEDGDIVDRDPGDDVTPDTTNPIILDLKVFPTGGGADVQLTANENGTYYYVVREKEDIDKGIMQPPSVKEILAGARGSGEVKENEVVNFEVTGLEEEKEYILYVIVADNADNLSNKESREFTTTDGTAPLISNLRGTPLHGGQRAELSFDVSEPGEYYYYYRLNTTLEDPTTQDIINNSKGRGTVTDAEETVKQIVTGLAPNSEYDMYVVMKDKWGNLSEDPPQKVTITTGDLDNTPPYVIDGRLYIKDPIKNEFFLEVSEELNKESAENIQNYILTGTGIVNTGLQQPIYPEKAVYDKTNNRVTLTIPSLTGFVNGDNLIVTVQPAVKDIADNSFENRTNVNSNVTPRNRAEYIHSDELSPVLTLIGEPEINPEKTAALINFNANKAGTYHYVIMESGVTPSDIDGREMIKAIQDNATKLDVKGTLIDIVGTGGNYPAQLGNQKINIPFPSSDKLNPYKSYDAYIVLRDRSGNVSTVRASTIIADKTAPRIQAVDITINSGDTTGRVQFESNELGELYYIVKKKTEISTIPTNADALRDYIIASGTNREMRVGTNTINISGLNRHEEYIFLLAVKDIFGNVTVYSEETMDSHGTVSRGPLMQYDFYSDGTKPNVNSVIRKLSLEEFKKINNPVSSNSPGNFGSITYEEDQTFLITFSESIINPSTPFFVIEDENGNELTNFTYEFEKMYDENDDNTVNSPQNTWTPSRMIIKFDSAITKDFKVTIDAGAVDINTPDGVFGGDNSFANAVADYKYPDNTMVNKIMSSVLTGDITSSGSIKYSSSMEILAQISTDLDWNQEYYYVVTNEAVNLNERQIINTIDHGDVFNGVIFYGKGVLDVSNASQASFRIPISTANGNNPSGANQVLMTGQKVYLLTIDQYGNVVMAYNGTDNFVKITAQ